MMIQGNVWKLVIVAIVLVTGCRTALRLAAVPKPAVVQEVPETMPVIPEPERAATRTLDGYRAEVVVKAMEGQCM
jgi:hypothetical protein